MKMPIITHTDGKGEHSEEALPVEIIRTGFGWKSTDLFPDDPFNGELRAYFEPSGYFEGSWSVQGFGHICTDKLWLREFKAGLRERGYSIKAVQNVAYSSIDRQGTNYVCLDIGPKFYTSWNRLSKKGAL
jgi:hypothetical protein